MEKKTKIVKLSKEQKEEEGDDRISRLSDDLIHKILSFVDAKLAVQTSALSKRWKLIWTTLPFLNFTNYNFPESNNTRPRVLFIADFFYRRNRQYQVLKLNIACPFPEFITVCYLFSIATGTSHNARELNWDFLDSGLHPGVLSNLSSTSLEKLKLRPIICEFSETGCWDLPALTTLHLALRTVQLNPRITLPASYLICLPSLRTLVLEGFQLPSYIYLPGLTTLYLTNCILPQEIWDFPALLTLKLDGVLFPESKFFSALLSLKNLILFFRENITKECLITCPQLANLEINACVSTTTSHSGKIIVLATKMRNFSSVGFFPIMFGGSELENVNVKLRGSNGDKTIASSKDLMIYFTQVIHMFPGMSSARILTLDLETIEALSAVSKFLVQFPSPFYRIKHVKVPKGKESSISPDLKRYLLGHSPKATIVTSLPRDELIAQMLPEKPLATLVAGEGSDQVSSSMGPSDSGLWKGHEVKLEFLGLLDCIEERYPETFNYFTTKSKKFCTIELNALCTTVKAFTNTSMNEVDAEMITEYRAQFADLQRLFNVKWLVNLLNYIEKLQFPCPLLDKLHAVNSRIDDAKSKLQDLQALRLRMMTESHRDIETMDTSLNVGHIGDNLFSAQ